VKNLVPSLLHSFSQIMLQKSKVTGILFVLGIGINSPIMLVGATIAILSALVTAKLRRYDASLINGGFYGYNAALAGMAVFYFFPVNVSSFSLVMLSGSMSSVIMYLILQFNSNRSSDFPVFTAPFIMTTWLLLLTKDLLLETQLIEIAIIDILVTDSNLIGFTANAYDDFYVMMRGVGQVMFQGHWLSGIAFIIGLLLHSYKVALSAVLGSLAGLIIARIFSFPEGSVLIGFYGFNASLVAIALTERYPNKQWPIALGIVISVFFTRVFELVPIAALTAPFVLASWLVIALVKRDVDEICEHS